MAVTKKDAPKKRGPKKRLVSAQPAPTQQPKTETSTETEEARRARMQELAEGFVNRLKSQFGSSDDDDDEDPVDTVAKEIYKAIGDQPYDVGLHALDQVRLHLMRQIEDKHISAKRAAGYFSKLLS